MNVQYGLDILMDEKNARALRCFARAFANGHIILMVDEDGDRNRTQITSLVQQRGISKIQFEACNRHTLDRLISTYFTIELKQKEIYTCIRTMLEAQAYEPLFRYIVATARALGASDIHISADAAYCFIRLRIHGRLVSLSIIDAEHLAYLCRVIKVKAGQDIARTVAPIDARISVTIEERSLDMRVAIVQTISGEKITLRLLNPLHIPKTLQELGLDSGDRARIESALQKSAGAILVTGPTGSGKSTTVRCLLDTLNDGQRHILTVEDPIEYAIEGLTQMQVHGDDQGFPQAMRALLRQDPDVIFIGEIRDELGADVAVKASITGHLVFSTLHTKTATAAVERLEGLGVERAAIVNALSLVINQRLVAEQCPHCLVETHYQGEEIPELNVRSGSILYESHGCPHCSYSGVAKRTIIATMVSFDEALQRDYLSGLPIQSENFEHILRDKLHRKEISLSEAKKLL